MADTDAERISDRILDRHLLYGFIHETEFVSPTSTTIRWTNGNGDAALWTGSYLAAEAFRYAVTRSEAAWNNLRSALESVHALSFVTDSGFLARTIFPLDSPFIDHFVEAEGRLGLFRTTFHRRDSYWVARPTRDQYSGVLFGLAITYDLVDDNDVRTICRSTIGHLVDALRAHWWLMGSPGHPLQETYIYRPDQLLSVLQVARHVDARFESAYDTARFFLSRLAGLPVYVDTADPRAHYFKFNLDYTYYYNLIRLEDSSYYRTRYLNQFARLRNATRAHGNPQFNMFDRALNGPDAVRDRETIDLLDALLNRGFRDEQIVSGDEAPNPLPVQRRPYADFLWQRNPFDLGTPGGGASESPGIDYILPYWMARYYGVITTG